MVESYPIERRGRQRRPGSPERAGGGTVAEKRRGKPRAGIPEVGTAHTSHSDLFSKGDPTG